jgi:hypothetical protein
MIVLTSWYPSPACRTQIVRSVHGLACGGARRFEHVRLRIVARR